MTPPAYYEVPEYACIFGDQSSGYAQQKAQISHSKLNMSAIEQFPRVIH
jgi:hypothetical protein